MTPPDNFRPRYKINYEALVGRKNSQAIVVFLAGCIRNPAFRLEKKCHPCAEWDKGNKSLLELQIKEEMTERVTFLDEKPEKPGAFDPTIGCAGCYYSFLDDIEDSALDDKGHVEFLIQNLEAAIEAWEWEDSDERGGVMRRYDSEPNGLKPRKRVQKWPEHARKIAEAKALLVEYRGIWGGR